MKQKLTEIVGWNAVLAALENKDVVVSRLYIADTRGSDARRQKACALAKEYGIPIEMSSRENMDTRWGREHQGVAAESTHNAALMVSSEDDLEELLEQEDTIVENGVTRSIPKLILILDGIQDPHNLGACLRTAGAAKVCCVIAPKDKSASLTPAARKVACGAAETVPFIQVTNLARTMKLLKSLGIWIYGLDQEADNSIYDVKFSGNIAIVMGSEEHGMRRLTIENCDDVLKIPMLGSMESLNVSVASGIALFSVRQSQNR